MFLVSATLCIASAESAGAAPRTREVVYTSACSCQNNKGVVRWRAKTDRSEPPRNPAEITPVTPSEICTWHGIGMVPWGAARTGNELRWFALTGRVITMQAESDGDIHLVLVNANDDTPGKVVVELPLGPRWCELRQTAFSWTNATFPFTANWRASPFRLTEHPVVTVVGRAFYDTDHSGKDLRTNRRPRERDKAVWEIHPVMQLEVKTVVEEEPRRAPSPLPMISPPPAPAAELIATITRPTPLKLPYGETILQPGTKLPVVSRTETTVTVRYAGGTETIPITATDLR